MNGAIVISGKPGAGSSTIASLLAKKLNYQLFIAGRLFKDIALGNITKQSYYPLFSQLCKDKGIILPSLSASNDEEAAYLIWNTIGKNASFHEAIDELQNKLAEQKNIIIEGKISIHLVKNAKIKIWLTAPFKTRTERQMLKNKISFEEASRLLGLRQERERREWLCIYGFDYWGQEKDADIIIDTSEKSPEEVLSIVLEKLPNNKL